VWSFIIGVLTDIPSLASWGALLYVAWLSDCGFLTIIAVSLLGFVICICLCLDYFVFFYYVLSGVGAPCSVCSAVVVMSVVKALSVRCLCARLITTYIL
jgi:hypothetical protein